ncbi:MAG: glycosyltransferase family 39 protein [Anaerolineae bacterium]|nr:glycosyltransferase family 39 protein [Anaerolineae bacterium]
MRVSALGDIPPGLYHDEAFNGLDALEVLEGRWPIYFAANNGREPLFIYLIAATVGLLGRTPGAIRLAAAISGTFTIPTTYLMARAWFNRRASLLSATILAITLWHVHLSRIGFRAVTLPLTTSLALWLGARAYRSRRWHDWLLAGLFYGLCFYAYLPARFSPITLIIFTLYLIVTGRSDRLWPGAAWFVAGSLLILAPLSIYTLGHWDIVMGRPGQVGVFNPLISGGDPWGTIGRQLVNTLGMFFIRGDTIPRHNLPGRPVFDPLMGIAMVLGLVWGLTHTRRRTATILALVWVGLMLVPTWLAEDAPHFLRAAGALPLLVVFPALGIEAAMGWLERRGRYKWAVALACAILAFSLAATVWDYFIRYGTDPQTAYAFEDAAVELTAEANRFTGVGWDGSGLTANQGSPQPGGRVYVDSRLWDEWEAIPFLVPESGSVIKLPAETISSPPDGEGQEGGAILLLLWPYEGLGRYQEFLPRNALIEAYGGPLARGDLEETPYEAYVAYVATPTTERPTGYLAHFGDQIALLDYTVEIRDQSLQIQLVWEALESPTENYTVFVHLRDGERIVAQDDGEPATGHYPTSLWRKGDLIVDKHLMEPPAMGKSELQLVVGLYIWKTMGHLEATTPTGASLGNELVLPFRINNER